MMFLMRLGNWSTSKMKKLDYEVVSALERRVRQYNDADEIVATWTETSDGTIWTRGKVTRV